MSRPEAVSQTHSLTQDVAEDSPRHFFSGFGEPTAVNCPGIRPEPTALGAFEELTGLDVHPFALPAGGKGENENDKLCKGEFTVTCKVFGKFFVCRVNILRD